MKAQDKPYDRAIREWLGNAFAMLMAQQHAISLAFLEVLDTQIAQTIEKRADIILGLPLSRKEKIKSRAKKGYEFILHGEIETGGISQSIVYRMAMYLVMILTQFKAPVFQFVFYIGNEPLKMPKFLQSVNYTMRFEIIDVKKVSKQIFLDMGTVEGAVLSVLGDWGNMPKDKIMVTIFQVLQEFYKTKEIQEKELSKAFSDLLIFSNLRNLQYEFTQTYKNMNSVLDFVKLEDPFWVEYFGKQFAPKIEEFKAQAQEAQAELKEVKVAKQKAEAAKQKAEAEKQNAIMRALLREKLTIDEIAEDFNVSKAYILAIQKEMKKR